MKREFLTISNLLSIFRGLLSIPFALVMLVPAEPLRLWALAIVLAGMLTDKLDGDLARRRGEETEWGRILDPLADKVCIAVMSLVLLVLGDLPAWFFGVLIGRDLLILAGGAYIKSTRGVVLGSNTAGKWTATAIAVTVLVLLLGLIPEYRWVLFAACTAGALLSLAMYAARLTRVLKEARA